MTISDDPLRRRGPASRPYDAEGLAVSRRDLIADADLIVPVPLHIFKLWSRRFNQAALLGKTIAAQTGKPFIPDALQRVKRTKPRSSWPQPASPSRYFSASSAAMHPVPALVTACR